MQGGRTGVCGLLWHRDQDTERSWCLFQEFLQEDTKVGTVGMSKALADQFEEWLTRNSVSYVTAQDYRQSMARALATIDTGTAGQELQTKSDARRCVREHRATIKEYLATRVNDGNARAGWVQFKTFLQKDRKPAGQGTQATGGGGATGTGSGQDILRRAKSELRRARPRACIFVLSALREGGRA